MLTDTPIEIAPEYWMRWKQDPVTLEIFRVLGLEREEWVRLLVEGDTLILGQEAVNTAKAVGAIYGLDALLIGLEEVLRSQWEDAKLKKEEEEQGDAE